MTAIGPAQSALTEATLDRASPLRRKSATDRLPFALVYS